MVFSSEPFIFIFLPVVFLLYSIVPGMRAKNVVLTIASLLFYAYGEPSFALIMVGSVVINYVLALVIARAGGKASGPDDAAAGSVEEAHAAGEAGVSHTAAQKLLLAVTVVVNLGLIGVFKYAGFFVTSVNQALGTEYPVPAIDLPIGISFFTFQALSYVIDVYRDPGTVQKNLGKVLLYISFFPQLIAGPIVKYHDIKPYLDNRKADLDEISLGIQRFVTGLAKKMFIANSMAKVADVMFALEEPDMSMYAAWIGAICYSLQIFFDFSGYSDMAIGIGHMFGFTIKENFDHPYIATSMKNFWRRWHISLSTWFKEYLYIPMGGSRNGAVHAEVNKLVVFFATGLWHGANWTFVVWGMIHGVAVTIEDIIVRLKNKALGVPGSAPKGDADDAPRGNALTRGIKLLFKGIGGLIGWFYTILIVVLAFVFFRSDTLEAGRNMIFQMFTGGMGTPDSYNTVMEVMSPYNIFLFAVALFACAPHPFLNKWLREKGPLSYVVTLVLFGLCVLELAGASFNPFIYFRF